MAINRLRAFKLHCWVLVAALVVLVSGPDFVHARDGFAPTTDGGLLEYFLVIAGGEVLEGVYADAHTPFITRNLLPLGCRCVGSLIVDDVDEDLKSALEYASSRAQLVIVTGGLGPTPNDITRETVAAFLGIELREDPELLEFLERRFRQPRDELRPNVRRQALVPAGGAFLPNPHGTAAGLIYPGNPPIIALPGPPRELQPMVRDALKAHLQEHFGVRPPGTTVTMRFVGAGQSLISQTLEDLQLLPPEVTVGSVFDGGRVDFSFSLPGHSTPDRRQLKELTAAIQQQLGQYLYATDDATLEDVVVAAFLERNASLVVSEIGSGGIVAASLHAGRRSEQLMTATLAAPTPEKMQALVRQSDPDAGEATIDQARRLAQQSREQIRTTWALVAIPDIQPDTGQPSLLVALAMPGDGWMTAHFTRPAANPEARFRFSTQLLDWLRRELARLP
jgi:molybdenum cofactor synthesis domain-containing protein